MDIHQGTLSEEEGLAGEAVHQGATAICTGVGVPVAARVPAPLFVVLRERDRRYLGGVLPATLVEAMVVLAGPGPEATLSGPVVRGRDRFRALAPGPCHTRLIQGIAAAGVALGR